VADKPTEGPQEPSLADVMAMQEQLLKAVQESSTPAEARENIEDELERQTDAGKIELTEEQRKSIAETTIAMLEERGAFGSASEEPPAEPVETPVEPPDGGGGAAEGEPASTEPSSDEPPVRRSLAERFQGR